MSIKILLLAPLAAALVMWTMDAGDPPHPKGDVPADVAVEPGTSRAWALMTCSVPFARDNCRHDLLAGMELKDSNVSAMRVLLEKNHGITKPKDITKLVADISKDKQKAPEVEIFKKLRESKLTKEQIESFPKSEARDSMVYALPYVKRMEKEKDGLLAYDYVRCIIICRLGYGAGYLTEVEAWNLIEPLAKKLQKAYASWEALGEIYAIGADVFDHKTADKTWEAWKKLKDDEKSPWKTVEWARPLASLAKAEPAPKK